MTLREGGVRKHAGAQSWVHDGLTISMRSSDFRLADLVFTCLLVAVLVALIVKNISLGSPIMAGDEYAYFAQAREFPTIDAIVSYDPTIQRTNNTLYLWIGSLLWRYSGQPALIMRVIQSVLYVLAIVVVFALGRCFMERRKSAIVALVTCCTAMSSYSAYFMPETLYQLLFFVLAALLVTISPARSVQGAAACGFVTALLMLTKPHGVAIAAAVTATLLVRLITPRNFGSSRRTAMSALVVFGLTTYLSMVLVNAILVGHFRFSPLLFVGTFYQDVLVSTEFMPHWRDLCPVLLGNGIALYILNGIPAILIGCALWLVVTRRTGEMEVPAKVLRTRPFQFARRIRTVRTSVLSRDDYSIHCRHRGGRDLAHPRALLLFHDRSLHRCNGGLRSALASAGRHTRLGSPRPTHCSIPRNSGDLLRFSSGGAGHSRLRHGISPRSGPSHGATSTVAGDRRARRWCSLAASASLGCSFGQPDR